MTEDLKYDWSREKIEFSIKSIRVIQWRAEINGLRCKGKATFKIADYKSKQKVRMAIKIADYNKKVGTKGARLKLATFFFKNQNRLCFNLTIIQSQQNFVECIRREASLFPCIEISPSNLNQAWSKNKKKKIGIVRVIKSIDQKKSKTLRRLCSRDSSTEP